MLTKEDGYRFADGIYCVFEAIVRVEQSVNLLNAEQYSIHRVIRNTAFGAAFVTVIASLPIMMALFDITLTTAPAITVYIMSAVVIGFWAYTVIDHKKQLRTLGLRQKDITPGPLGEQLGFHMDRIAMYGHRIRLLKEIEEGLLGAKDQLQSDELSLKLARNQAVLEFCKREVEETVKKSARLKEIGQRTADEHERVVFWAQPFLASDNDEGSS